MMPALLKVEYFGGPADGDKRLASGELEFWSADGTIVHRYCRGKRGMEWSGALDQPLPGDRVLLMLAVGRDGR